MTNLGWGLQLMALVVVGSALLIGLAYESMSAEEFQREMSTAELHHRLGERIAAREESVGMRDTCVLSAAYRCGVPCYVSSPGDSGIGLMLRIFGSRIADHGWTSRGT